MGGLNLGLALGGSGQTRLDPRSALAQQLIAGAGSGPVAHPTQGYGRLAKMLLAAYLMKQGEKRETQGREAIQSALGQALGGPVGIDLPVPPEEFVPGQPATVSPRRQPDMAAALATLSGAPQTASVADMQKALLGEAFSERRWERDKGQAFELLKRQQEGALNLQTAKLGAEKKKYTFKVGDQEITEVRDGFGNVLERYEAPRYKPETTISIQDRDLPTVDREPFNAARAAADSSYDVEASADRLDQLMAEGVRTGSLQPSVTSAAAFLSDAARTFGMPQDLIDKAQTFVGMDADKVAGSQEYKALTNRLTLDLTAKLKGSLQVKELEFLKESMANLGTSEEANRRISHLLRQGAIRSRRKFELMDQYREDHKSLAGFSKVWHRYMEDNPIEPPPGGGTRGAPAAEGGQSVDFGAMSADDIAEFLGNAPALSSEQYDAIDRRLKALGR